MTNAETSLRASAKQAPPVPAGILRAQSPQLSRNASNPKFSGILKSSTQFTHTVDEIFRWVLFVRLPTDGVRGWASDTHGVGVHDYELVYSSKTPSHKI